MNLEVSKLAKKMIEEFENHFSNQWRPEVKGYAEAEAKKLAENFVMIERLFSTNEISEEQAKIHHEIQINATRIVFLTVEGLGMLAVEKAINAAMMAIKNIVNNAMGISLL